MNLVRRVYETIDRYRMISSGDSVLLGVSGGPDSVALLHLLDELKRSLDFTLAVAHFDHGIRGEEGRGDAVFTQELAARLEIPFYLGENGSVAPVSSTGNLEAQARAARYRFLGTVANRFGLTKIAVGHTQDDQAETMLMWLFRGCGPSGLGGMPAVRPVHVLAPENARPMLIRPLLDVPRVDVIRYLERSGFSFREDSTNADTRYLRNWIRADLLPELVKRTDDHLKLRLGRLSALLQGDELLLDQVVARVSRDIIHAGVLMRDAFLDLDPGLRLRVLRFWLRSHLAGLRGIGFQHVNSVEQLIVAERPSGHVSLPGGWTVIKNYDSVCLIQGDGKPRTDDYVYELPVEGELVVPEVGVTVRTWCSSRAEAVIPENLFQAMFDRAVVGGNLQLRSRRRGDRFQPLGMAGHKKVKDLLIQKKVARSLRGRLPLLLFENEIVWIPGCGRSDSAKVSEGTREVWNIAMSPIDLGKSGSY